MMYGAGEALGARHGGFGDLVHRREQPEPGLALEIADERRKKKEKMSNYKLEVTSLNLRQILCQSLEKTSLDI
jgi:hypothetical protein